MFVGSGTTLFIVAEVGFGVVSTVWEEFAPPPELPQAPRKVATHPATHSAISFLIFCSPFLCKKFIPFPNTLSILPIVAVRLPHIFLGCIQHLGDLPHLAAFTQQAEECFAGDGVADVPAVGADFMPLDEVIGR